MKIGILEFWKMYLKIIFKKKIEFWNFRVLENLEKLFENWILKIKLKRILKKKLFKNKKKVNKKNK